MDKELTEVWAREFAVYSFTAQETEELSVFINYLKALEIAEEFKRFGHLTTIESEKLGKAVHSMEKLNLELKSRGFDTDKIDERFIDDHIQAIITQARSDNRVRYVPEGYFPGPNIQEAFGVHIDIDY